MTFVIVDIGHPALDPGVHGLKRLRLTPKLVDWLASRFLRRRRRRDSFQRRLGRG